MTATASSPASQPRAVAGDGLLNVFALGAVVVLIINDHFLKAAWPGVVTGKVSDFAGLLFFPLFLQAAVEVISSLLGRWRAPRARVLLVAVALTGFVFTSIKTLPMANEAAARTLGLAQFLVGQLTAPASVPHAVSIALDPRDLIALPMLAVAYAIGMRRCRTLAP